MGWPTAFYSAMPTVYFRMTNDDFMPCIHSWQYIFLSNAYVIPIPFHNAFYMSRISRIFLDVWWWISPFFFEYLRMIPMPCSGPDGAYVVSAVMQLIQSEAGGVNPQNHQKWVVETIAKCWVYGVAFPTVKYIVFFEWSPPWSIIPTQFLTYTTWKSLFLAYTLTFFLAFYLASILT